jgi:hypothetical protein
MRKSDCQLRALLIALVSMALGMPEALWWWDDPRQFVRDENGELLSDDTWEHLQADADDTSQSRLMAKQAQ